MKGFFSFLGTFTFSFFSGFGALLIRNVEFVLGLLAILVIGYVIYVLAANEEHKLTKAVQALAGLGAGIFAAAAIQ